MFELEQKMNAHGGEQVFFRKSMFPAAASVLTISAPSMLLSASLNSFLIGLGVYLGFVWTRNLDSDATSDGSRDVFIVYITCLAVFYGVYSLSISAHRAPGQGDMM